MRQFVKEGGQVRQVGGDGVTVNRLVADGGAMQRGDVVLPAMPAGGATSTQVNITFPTPFTQVPSVYVMNQAPASADMTSSIVFGVAGVSPTGFQLYARNVISTAVPAGRVVRWTAVAGGVVSLPAVSGGGGVSYSADVQDTGLKWVDGEKVYQVTFRWPAFTLAGGDAFQRDLLEMARNAAGFGPGFLGVDTAASYIVAEFADWATYQMEPANVQLPGFGWPPVVAGNATISIDAGEVWGNGSKPTWLTIINNSDEDINVWDLAVTLRFTNFRWN